MMCIDVTEPNGSHKGYPYPFFTLLISLFSLSQKYWSSDLMLSIKTTTTSKHVETLYMPSFDWQANGLKLKFVIKFVCQYNHVVFRMPNFDGFRRHSSG